MEKFVRIEPGSMLQLLYPCSRYSTDRCLVCGGKFQDHLKLWWSRHLYTPFDLYVDQVYKDGVVRSISDSGKTGRKSKVSSSAVDESSRPAFCFHRRYVLDLTHLLKGVEDPTQKKKMVQRSVGELFPRVQQNRFSIEIRNALPYSSSRNNKVADEEGLSYAVPAVDLRRIRTAGRAITFVTIRELCLSAVESIIDLERLDDDRARNSRSSP